MKAKISGQCLCGAIEYSCTNEPKFSLICQCTQCQKITGTGHACQFVVNKTDTTIKGELKTFELSSDSGSDVKSAFCANCGNPIYKTTTMMPDALVFHAATLDHPKLFEPELVVHSSSAQPWDHVDPSIARK